MWRARFAEAGRNAVQALVDETIASKAAFLIIAGDIFDGDWKDVTTGLFFVRAHQRAASRRHSGLHRQGQSRRRQPDVARSALSRQRHGVPDARPRRSRSKSYRVALHGRSFADRADAAISSRPIRRAATAGSTSACCTPRSTAPAATTATRRAASMICKRFGYDYWALGHVHAAEIVSRDPWIVFPGNLQGRSVRETGAKGAMRVTVEDGRIVDVTPLALDGARWAHLMVDIADGADEAEVSRAVSAALCRCCRRRARAARSRSASR